MIVDAVAYLFDHRRFRRDVVPAMRRLHAAGEAEPWVEAVWNDGDGARSRPVPRFTPWLREATAGLMAAPDLAAELPAALIPRPAPARNAGDPPRPREGSPPTGGHCPATTTSGRTCAPSSGRWSYKPA
ncbi:hypothetical protein [Streptomyces avicenniae]|uniref:hypothetical protein n=1 Tax=Streptomyces avicenniae TaxID=500153 RepID=UPI00069BFD57|nr:hypothetical protein [Streptomyces avicenniae]